MSSSVRTSAAWFHMSDLKFCWFLSMGLHPLSSQFGMTTLEILVSPNSSSQRRMISVALASVTQYLLSSCPRTPCNAAPRRRLVPSRENFILIIKVENRCQTEVQYMYQYKDWNFVNNCIYPPPRWCLDYIAKENLKLRGLSRILVQNSKSRATQYCGLPSHGDSQGLSWHPSYIYHG